MTAGELRTEVLDSEVEPMTSSPVDVSDAAADKLCAAAPVALQDAQDALQESARPHQANAENTAKSPTHRTGGLEADQENASTNDVPPIDTQPAGEAAASAQGRMVAAHHSEVTPFSETTSSLSDTQVANVVSHPAVMISSTTSDGQRETNQAMAKGRPDTTDPSTDVALPITQGASHNGGAETKDVPFSKTAAMTPAPDEASSFTNDLKLEERNLAEVEEQHANTPGSVDGHPNEDLMDVVKHETKPPGSSALHSVSTPEDSPMEGTASEDVTSSAKYLTGIDHHQDAEHDADARMTDDSTSLAPAQNSDNDHIAEQPTVPAEGQDLFSHRENVDVDVEMADVNPSEVDPETSNTSSLTSTHEQAVPTDSAPTKSQESARSPKSIPATGNDSHPLPGSDLRAAESGSVSQESSEQFKASASEDNVTSHVVTDAGATSQASEAVSTAPEPEPKKQQIDAAKNVDAESPTVAKTPQEITLDELKAQKAALLSSLASLPAIRILMEEHASSNAEASDEDDEPTEKDIMTAANKIVKDHIKLLHEYNELKDVGQGLMGLIADQRGVRIIEVQEEFGVDAKD